MNKSYLNSMNNTVLSIKPSRAIRLLLMVLFFTLFGNVAGAQIASSTWALTSKGNSANVGNVTGTALITSAEISDKPTFSNASGVSAGNWSKDARKLKNDEYYEFKVTPNAGTIFNVTAINFEHSVSAGNWKVQAYYSTDNFATSTPISTAFDSNSNSPAANNNTVNINVDGKTLSIRIYGWESDNDASLRIRNVVVSGKTCINPSVPGTSSAYSPTCSGFTAQWGYSNNATAYFMDVATNSSFSPATIVPAYNNLNIGNVMSLVLSGLNPGTTYYYRVRGFNSCGTSSSSNTMSYATSPVPTVAPVAKAPTYVQCFYAQLNFTTGSNSNVTGVYLDIARDNGFTDFISGYNNYDVAYNNGSIPVSDLPAGTLYYRIRGYNSCGVTSNSNTISFSTPSPIGGNVSSAQSICSGTSPANLTLTGYSTTNTEILKWQKSSDAAFSSPIDIPVTTSTLSGTTIGKLTANTYFRAVVGNKFGSWCQSFSNPVLISIAPTPIVTPNKVNETCPSSNNGAISPTISGGLANVRYIKLTQKYTVDAYQQVAEIQAFEIFTGTNVALSTSGAVATASSVWVGSTGPNYIPSNVNNGVTTGDTFWHSATSNLNEWVKIDLQSAKNIDYLKIYNRTDCCSERGQNMLLELFDASNNLVYSKTIDLYQSGANMVNVNVLDVTWADGATTLNRTALDSGTYTLKYADAGGCSAINYPITIGATNASPSTPIVGTITQPTCSTATGSFTISNYNAANTYTITPSTGVSRTGAVVTAPTGSYTISTSSSGCVSVNANFTINAQPAIPTAPTLGSITQPTCSTATGSFTISNYNAANTYTITPSIGVSRTGAVVTAPAGTYTISVSLSGCFSSATSFTINAQPAIPNIPTIGTVTQPTCSTATGSFVLNGLPSGSWALTRSPGNITTTGTGTSTTISGLSSGSYTYSVVGLTNGLKGEYFNNMTLSGTPILTRTDATVNFDWVNGSPDASINNDGFSVRWSGQIQPLYSENYTFTTRSDDGVKLWVNGTLVINNWTDHAAVDNTGSITLTAGVKYDIVLEYYENGGQAVSQLSWKSTSQATQIIPQSQLFSAAGCSSSTSANVVINAQPTPPTTPILGTIANADCVTETGSVILSGLPASGTINQTGTAVNSYTITGTTMTITGLIAGTYNFSASNGACTSSATGNVVINTAITNTWNGAYWSNGKPNSTQKIVFSGDYPPAVDPNVDIAGCSCKITGNKTVTIKSGHTLTITNGVTVEGTGSLVFENNASLVQINNDPNINSGDIEYQRSTNTDVRKTDYVYWSSPVLDQNLGDLSTKTANGTYYSFDSGIEDWKQEFDNTTMDVGKGYIVRRPDFISGVPVMTEKYTAYFVGKPNNGIITVPIGYTGAAEGTSNLLGNPYPSAIDADEFLAANAGVLDGVLYFWTHNTAIQLAKNITNGTAGSGALAYTSDDYSSYNATGGVGTGTGNFVNGVEQTANKPTGKIAAGQGFFATSKAAGNVTFKNEMRVAGINTQFFKTKNPNGKTANTIEKNRVWLNLTNTEGAFKQTLIGYVTDATNDYDSRFDGESFDANEFVDFYSVNQDKNLVIQGRALPFDAADEVQLGYRTTIDGTFTINIDQTDGLLANQAVFLEDKVTNTTFDLKNGNYTFTTIPGTFNDRFVLKYTNKTLSVDTIEKEDGILAFYSNNYNTLIIRNDSMDTIVNSVSLFNMTGQNIGVWDVSDNEQTSIQIPIKQISSGIYIVKAKTTNGESSKKIIVN